MSELFLRHKFQTRKLFSEYSIRKMEMDVLQGYTVIKIYTVGARVELSKYLPYIRSHHMQLQSQYKCEKKHE